MAEWSRRFSWGASGTVDLTTEEGRAFLQERLALFGQVGFLIDVEGARVVEVCAHHLHTPAEPPSLKLGRALPADLERLVLDCLEKQPERRPQSAAELVERLEAGAGAAAP